MCSEFVPANRLYDVKSRTSIAHPANQATDEDVRYALEDREIRADGGQPSSGTEWATPAWIWRPLADSLGGFDLDPAAGCEPTPIADEQFTKSENGLARSWFGDVWLNPPYSRKHNEKWAKKAAAEARREEVDTLTALVPNSTGSSWYQDYYGTADLETHVRGRVEFLGAKNHDPSFYSVLITWGDVPPEYVEALQSLGEVRPIPPRETHQVSLVAATDGGTSFSLQPATEREDGDSR